MEYTNYVLLVALCAASISYTIGVTSLFEWLRNLVTNNIKGKAGELIHPYYLGHYAILVIMLTTRNIKARLIPITDHIVYDFIFTWFCIVCIMALLHYFMNLAYKPTSKDKEK